MGGDPREDTGGDRAGEVGLVFFGQRSVQLVDGGKFAVGHLPHQRIDLERRRNDETALPEFLGKLAVAAVAVLVQVLGVVELGHPVDADTLDRHDSKNVSNRGKKTN
jgi:hypothetical protein